MERALAQAKRGADNNEIPVGAVLVERSSGIIISEAHNFVEIEDNALLHAELVVLNMAAKKLLQKNFINYDLYITLEPCIMCATAISYAKVGKIFYGASNLKLGSIQGDLTSFFRKNHLYSPEVYGGIKEKQASKLLKEFFLKLRS